MSTLRRIAHAVKVAIKQDDAPASAAVAAPVAPPAPPPLPEVTIPDEIPGITHAEYDSTTPEDHADNAAWKQNADGKAYSFFFLCGHPRSGTNWMGALLNRHPKINCQGEYRFEGIALGFRQLTMFDWHAAYHEPIKSEAEACFRDTIRRVMLASRAKRPDATVLGDRTPRGLDVYLQGAPHLWIVRDPRDVLVSSMFVELKNALWNYSLPRFKPRLEPLRERFLADTELFDKEPHLLLCDELFVKHLAHRWVHHTQFDLDQLERIKHGDVRAKVRVLRYEKFHADVETERAAMYSFLGLDPAEATPLDDKSRTKPGIRNGEAGTHYRKGEPGDWRRFFHDDAKRWFNEVSGTMLVRMGYERDLNW